MCTSFSKELSSLTNIATAVPPAPAPAAAAPLPEWIKN
jgi:hypothetical protein